MSDDVNTVLMLGRGQTGQSVCRYWERRGVHVDVSEPHTHHDWQDVWDSVSAHRYDLVMVSPGIKDNEILAKIKNLPGQRVMTDIDLFMSHAPRNVIGLTGTNGKTTCVHWLADILSCHGHTLLLGNVGTPVLDAVENLAQADWVILELSSFQLAHSQAIALKLACVLNIHDDHLDWHPSLKHYHESKWRIGEKAQIKLAHHDLNPDSAWYRFGGEEQSSPLPADLSYTQYQNALAVHRMCQLLDLPLGMDEVLAKAPKLRHRMEVIGTRNQWIWVNDSKATNMHAAKTCLKSMRRQYPGTRIIWLAGGVLKERVPVDIHDWADDILGFGRDGHLICSHHFPTLQACLTYLHGESIRCGSENTMVCLSPAGASFDEFSNYQHRGDMFCQWLKEVTGECTNTHD